MLKEHVDLPGSIEFFLVFIECQSVPVGTVHGCDETVLVDEREQCDAHPLIPRPIDVDVEVGRVEIDYLRLRVRQQVPIAQGDRVCTLPREHTQELLKGCRWLTHLKPTMSVTLIS